MFRSKLNLNKMETIKPTLMCPMCASTSLSANKKGYNGNTGGLGMAFMGTKGLALGMQGMNEVEITCLNCGNTFKPGEGAASEDELEEKEAALIQRKQSEKNSKAIGLTIALVLIIIVCVVFYNYFSFLF